LSLLFVGSDLGEYLRATANGTAESPRRRRTVVVAPGQRLRRLLEQLHRDPVWVSQVESEAAPVDARVDLDRRAHERRDTLRQEPGMQIVQIVDAGLILLAERPPEGLTVDAIVESAGVAKGTFYYHFQSVEELVAAVGAKLADTFDALARLEDTITLAPRDAIPTAHHAVADRTQHTGAVIIRDPRLTRARSDQSGGAEETGAGTSATQEIGAISEAMEVLSAEISHHQAKRP